LPKELSSLSSATASASETLPAIRKNRMKYSIIFISLIVISCQKKVEQKLYTLPNNADVSAIVQTIVTDRKSPIFKTSNDANLIPLCTELKKISLINWNEKKSKYAPYVKWNSIVIQDLIGSNGMPESLFHFQKSDSSYIKFQTEKSKTLITNQNSLESIKYTNVCDQSKTKVFYSLTIPILSENKEKAYCQLTLNCSGLCGAGYKIYLKKVRTKWLVERIENSWVS
jgi:hypothetical protein